MRRLPLTWRLKAKYCQRESICRAMAPSTLSLFLTALMFAGANAADADLGEDCSGGKNCVHPTLELVCDDITSTCRIKDGQACDGDGYGDLCVSGATCTSNVCACQGVYTSVAATGKCVIPVNLWGATCTPDSDPSTTPQGDCTAGSGLACPTGATKCQCEADKKVDLATGKCTVAIAAEKVGTACTTQTECGTQAATHLTCQATTKCVCEAGYNGPTGGDCTVIAASKVGHSCTAGTATADCGAQATTNLECGSSSNVCECVTNYNGVAGGVCYPAKGQLNGGCSATADCSSVSNTVCTGSSAAKKCVCETGYSADAAGTACAVTANTFGGTCTGGPTGKGTCVDANAKCSADSGGTCGCQDTYSGAIGESCVLKNTIGGACTGTADTKGTCVDANALCKSTSKCDCKDGYNGPDGGTCTKIADNTFGGSCTTTTANTKGTCEDANALCSATTGGFCTCANGYAGIAGSGCALPNKLGGSCTTMTKGTQGTCEDAGATCSAQEDGRCIKSGAKAVVASVTSLVLACIVCLLAIN